MPRGESDAAKVRELMRRLGREARGAGRVYLVGGASAVLVGWRETTVDVDLKLDPEPPGVFDAMARAKEALDMNIELAAPDERGHAQDLRDVRAMIARDLVRMDMLAQLFDAIAPDFPRHPAIDIPSFRRRVEVAVETAGSAS